MAIVPGAPEDSDYARIKREQLAAAQARVAKADRGELTRAVVRADERLVAEFGKFTAKHGDFKRVDRG